MDQIHLQVIEKMRECKSCSLSQTRKNVVVGDYANKKGICFIGEGPGYNEDVQAKPFVGKSGSLLNEMLEAIGLNRKDVSVLNIVKCRPPNNRNPTSEEQSKCGKLWLSKQIDYLNPKMIVVLGSVALNYFIPRSKITKVKGVLLQKNNLVILPMFHPSYVLRGGSTKESYQKDFELLLKTFKNLENKVQDKESLNKERKQASLDDFT